MRPEDGHGFLVAPGSNAHGGDSSVLGNASDKKDFIPVRLGDGFPDLFDARYHREHDPQFPLDTGTQNRPELDLEEINLFQAEPDGPEDGRGEERAGGF